MDPALKISQGGKLEVSSKIKLTTENLTEVYTPGVAKISEAIAKDKQKAYDFTWKSRSVAIVSDGSAVLGLGNLGATPALPVMEAKAILFKELAGVDAVPLVLDTQDPEEIVKIVEAIAPGFGGINLEDIAAPNCFFVEEKLKKSLDIPVFHDDQWGTAIVVLAGLINALKWTKKDFRSVKTIISGAGAAGIAITRLLLKYGFENIIVYDSQGPLYKKRDGMNKMKEKIAEQTNLEIFKGGMKESLAGADIFVGVSRAGLLDRDSVEAMNQKAIVFSLANPVPEIMPEEIKDGKAEVIATGRSDYPNQINNALVFPGIFKGALTKRTTLITDEIKINIAKSLAFLVKTPTQFEIIPKVIDDRVSRAVANCF
ncbi:MAG: NADP-dependent malic enzyme [Patescibacteria group bacterium]|nr:NADP-dependent malic enzyme [Patescibacteria group bacterium]